MQTTITQYLTLFDQLREPCLALNASKQVIAWSDDLTLLSGLEAKAMLGLSQEQHPFLGQPSLQSLYFPSESRMTLYSAVSFGGVERLCVLQINWFEQGKENAWALCRIRPVQIDGGSESRFQKLFDESPDPVWIIENNQFVNCNDAAVRFLGYENKVQLLNTHPSKLSPPVQPDGIGSFEKAEAMMKTAIDRGIHRFEWVHVKADGTEFDAEVTLARLEIGGKKSIYCTWRDISERKKAEKQLALYASVFQHSGEALLISDANNRIVAVNQALENLCGYSQNELKGKNPKFLSAGQTLKSTYVDMWKGLDLQSFWQGELVDKRKDGSIYAKWASISVVKDGRGNTINYIASFTDLSARNEAEAKIDWLAHHDGLTELLNRHGLTLELDNAIEQCKNKGHKLALVFLDLDRFKVINDTLGHFVGDLLLNSVAERLTKLLRKQDILARLGGDEFIVVINELVSMECVLRVIDKITHELNKDYLIEGKVLHVTPSLGISLFPIDGMDADSLMRKADTAMYHAKESGRNNAQFYSVEMGKQSIIKMELERALWEATELGQFELFYQPILDLQDGKIGFEALLRWRHPNHGLVSPAMFISIAEESGSILEIGRWVLHNVFKQIKRWLAVGEQVSYVSINISTVQLYQPGLVEFIAQLLREYKMVPQHVVLEITESVAMERPHAAIKILNSLKALGVKIAMDDFGTGHSSLGYLQSLPIDILKLDRCFIKDMCCNKNDAAITAAAIALAHRFNMKTVAEGVETDEQLGALIELGCDKIQGYLFSRPQPASEISAMLTLVRKKCADKGL